MIRFGHVSCMTLGYHVAYEDKVKLLLCSMELALGWRVGSPLKSCMLEYLWCCDTFCFPL